VEAEMKLLLLIMSFIFICGCDSGFITPRHIAFANEICEKHNGVLSLRAQDADNISFECTDGALLTAKMPNKIMIHFNK
jgi:hypothetical protein